MTFKELTRKIIEKPDCAVNCGIFSVKSTHEFVYKQNLIVNSDSDPKKNCKHNKDLMLMVWHELFFERTFPVGTDFYNEFSNKQTVFNTKRK